jgi:hypothetical protein
MAAPIRPASVSAFGTEKWVYVPTIADLSAPSLAVLNGATSLDVTKMLMESSARPDASTEMARAERRVGDVESFEFPGETQWTGGEMMYQFAPQAAALSDGKKAYEKFPQGTAGFLVRRLGINRDTDFAVGQFVSIFPVAFGVQVETTVGEGATREVVIKQGVGVTAAPSTNKAIVA